jgi:tellurite resistance protein
MAAYLDDRNDELLDAVAATAALVARADGRIDPVERGLLVDVMDRNGFLGVFAAAEIAAAFERHAGALAATGRVESAIDELRRHRGRAVARLLVEAGEGVAAADGRLDPGERRVLERIRAALDLRLAPAAPVTPAGGAR